MIGNIVISIICGTIHGTTAVILGLPYRLALAVIAAILDMVPNVGSLIAGIIIGVVALSVSTTAVIVLVIVILVHQQFENYVLQPTIIGKAANISGFRVILSVLGTPCSASSARSSESRSPPGSSPSSRAHRRSASPDRRGPTPEHHPPAEHRAAG